MFKVANLIRSLVVILAAFILQFAIPATAAPKNKSNKGKIVLSGSEFKKLKPAEARKYLSKVQAVWVAYEKSFNSKKYSSFQFPTLIFGMSAASAADPLWCEGKPERTCYAAGYKSCKGSSETDSSRLCRNQSSCDGKGMGCNPAIFGNPKGKSQFCIQPDPSSGYANISASCYAAANAAKPEEYEFNADESAKFLETNESGIQEFCSSHKGTTASWTSTCNALTEATVAARTAILQASKPLVTGGEDAVVTIETATEAPIDATVQPAGAPTEPVEAPAAAAEPKVVVPPAPPRQWCSEDPDFDFPLEKSGLIGRQEDGLKTKVGKDGSVEHKIARGTNCMMCGFRIACGDLVGNKINKMNVSFRKSCDDTNKEFQERLKLLADKKTSQLNGEGCNTRQTRDFAKKWIKLYAYLNKGINNKENAKDMENDVVDYYKKGRAAGLFCASGASQINPNSKNIDQSWGDEALSPVVAVPAFTGYKRANGGGTQEQYQASLVNMFNLGAFENADDSGAKKTAESSVEFLCGRTQAVKNFGITNVQPATGSEPARDPHHTWE